MKAFIYIITNAVNGKRYVGLTKRSVDLRFKEHQHSAALGQKTHLYNAIRKYGKDKFSVRVLEETTLELVASREKFFIADLNPEYNMTLGGESRVSRVPLICITNGDQEWYIPKADQIPEGCWRGRAFANIASSAAGQIGKKRSQDAIDQTAAKHRGMKRTEETRLRMSFSAKAWGDRHPKGENHSCFGKHFWNNGVLTILSKDCPDGWVKGRLSTTGVSTKQWVLKDPNGKIFKQPKNQSGAVFVKSLGLNYLYLLKFRRNNLPFTGRLKGWEIVSCDRVVNSRLKPGQVNTDE